VRRRPDGGEVPRIEDEAIEGIQSHGNEQFVAGPEPQEGLMSASTRTVQQTLGTRQIGAVLVAVALAIVLAVAVALGQSAATKPKTAPAVSTAPVFIDRGSRDEIGPGAAIGTAPVIHVEGSPGYISAAAAKKAPVIHVEGSPGYISAAAAKAAPVTYAQFSPEYWAAFAAANGQTPVVNAQGSPGYMSAAAAAAANAVPVARDRSMHARHRTDRVAPRGRIGGP
jgi:hypothetical protein